MKLLSRASIFAVLGWSSVLGGQPPVESVCYLPPAANAIACLFTKTDTAFIHAVSPDARVVYVGIEGEAVVEQMVVNGRVFKAMLLDEIELSDRENQGWQVLLPDWEHHKSGFMYEFIVLNTATGEMTYYAMNASYAENPNRVDPMEIITEIYASKDPAYVEKKLASFGRVMGDAGP